MRFSYKKFLLLAGLLLLLFVGWFGWQLFGPNPPIIVSKETTYITAPLRADGLPDYEKYVLEKMREGVTPENNAAVLFWQAMGPGDTSAEEFEIVAKEIGLEKIPTKDECLKNFYGEENRTRVIVWLKQEGIVQRVDEEEDFERFGDPPWTDSDDVADGLIDQTMDRPWTSEQIPPLGEWTQANEKPLELLLAASQRPRFYSPSATLLNDSPDLLIAMLLPSTQSARDAARSLSSRAMWHLGEGHPTEAWGDLLALYRLSRLIGEGNTLIEQLVTIAIERIAANATLTLLDDPGIFPDVAKTVLRDLQSFSSRSAIGVALYDGDRLQAVDAMLSINSQELNDGNSDRMYQLATSTTFDWNVSLSQINGWYDEFAPLKKNLNWSERNASLANYHARLERLENMSPKNRVIRGAFSRKERAGIFSDWLAALFIPAASAALSAEDRANTQLTLTQLAAAIAVYRTEHGEYPEKLEALVPDILDKLPGDLFHDNPFAYRRTDNGYLLYSLGPNGQDDGGSNLQMHVYKGYLADEESAAQLHELLGDDLPMVEDETAVADSDDPVMVPFGVDDSLDEHIPQDADDIAIRLPLPKLELPKRVEPKE